MVIEILLFLNTIVIIPSTQLDLMSTSYFSAVYSFRAHAWSLDSFVSKLQMNVYSP